MAGLRRLPPARARWGQAGACFTAAILGGVVVLYCIGIPVGSAVGDIPLGKFLRLSMNFVPGDIAKAVAATLVATSAFRAAPFLHPSFARARP